MQRKAKAECILLPHHGLDHMPHICNSHVKSHAVYVIGLLLSLRATSTCSPQLTSLIRSAGLLESDLMIGINPQDVK